MVDLNDPTLTGTLYLTVLAALLPAAMFPMLAGMVDAIVTPLVLTAPTILTPCAPPAPPALAMLYSTESSLSV